MFRTKQAPKKDRRLALRQLEPLLAGDPSPRPSDVAVIRGTALALRIMDGCTSGTFATIECERTDEGLHVVSGREHLDVARMLCARAIARGDLHYAMELARGLNFRVVDRPGTSRRTKRSAAKTVRTTGRLAVA